MLTDGMWNGRERGEGRLTQVSGGEPPRKGLVSTEMGRVGEAWCGWWGALLKLYVRHG